MQVTLFVVCWSYATFPQDVQAEAPRKATHLTGELQRLVSAEVAANPSLPGELLHVDSPRQKLNVDLAAGVFDRDSQRPLDPRDLFRVASVTKTFVAASILKLYEEGKIKLDDPIDRYLPKEYTQILDTGGYPTSVITVRQLLTHTIGIHDYAQDPKYYEEVLSNPTHRWTRMEQVQSAIKWGTPHFAPGQGYHYSDTGFILLGEMIEQLTGKPLAEALRRLLSFKKLGLKETYLETLEPVPTGVRGLSHPYFGEIDAVGFDASIDLYGGGGLVSSVSDLARFYRALFAGKVYRHAATLQIMLVVPSTNNDAPGGPYAMGIASRKIVGNACWGHTGFWGTSAYYCPNADITIVRHYNQARPAREFTFNSLHTQIAQLLQFNAH